jgi:hypothetical protein
MKTGKPHWSAVCMIKNGYFHTQAEAKITMPNDKVKIATLAQLRAINERGVGHAFNQLLSDDFFDSRKLDEMFAVQFLTGHEFIVGGKPRSECYCCLVYPMDKEKQGAFLAKLDMAPEDFDLLLTSESLGIRPVFKNE